MLEPLPGAVIGLIGVTLAAVLAPWVLYSPAELARPGFKPAEAGLAWALSGFANSTVWLIFAAFMFALGYEKTGLGRRISLSLVKLMGRRTLTLGYAVTAADLVLAPFTPSNTARSAGTIFPVIKNLPPFYQSAPNDPSARKIGGYLMWTAIAATCVTSSMFLTGLAPNLLAVELIKKTSKMDISWAQWFLAFAPVGIVLLLLTPLLVYWLYPPEIKKSEEIPAWAGQELHAMGGLTRREGILAVLVVAALTMWIFGGQFVSATTAALIVIGLMLVTGVVSWDEMLGNKQAWNTLAWFATLVALADGLNKVGFVKWFADAIAGHMVGFSPTTAMVALVLVFFVTHYMFASLTAHTTALLPVMLVVGSTIPGIPMRTFALLLVLSLGIMGILTPYATGPSPVYYGSGYLPGKDYWRLGAVFGLIFIVALLGIGAPWNLTLGRERPRIEEIPKPAPAKPSPSAAVEKTRPAQAIASSTKDVTMNPAIVRQFGKPSCLLGELAGLIMTLRPSNRERSERTLDVLGIRPGDDVLEIGYGPGLAIKRASKLAAFGRVVGIDHSRLMWRQAGRRNADAIAAGKVELLLGSAEHLPDLSYRFDKVFAVNVYMFWKDPVAILRGILSVMSGGRIAVTFQPRSGDATSEDARVGGQRTATSLREAGFENVRVELIKIDPVDAACVIGQSPG